MDWVGFSGSKDPLRTIRMQMTIQRSRLASITSDSVAQISNDTLVGGSGIDTAVYSQTLSASNFSYDSEEQSPGQTFHIAFPAAGTFPVRCHIHPKMLLTVHVK